MVEGDWNYTSPAKETGQTLFSIQDRRYTVKDFFDYVRQNQKPTPTATAGHLMRLLYDNYTTTSLLNYEREHLETKHQDYRMLVKEYRDGILLFQLMDEKVWSKAITDSVGLQAYFQKNQANYQWDTRAEATIISAANKATLAKAQQLLNNDRYELPKSRPEPVTFAAGKDLLTAATTNRLNALADRLINDPNLTLVITGHADTQESSGKNADLATRRAQQVVAYLTGKGLAANRLTIQGVKPPATPAGNRRVTFALYTTDVKGVEEVLNGANPLAVQVLRKRFQKGEHKALDAVNWQAGTYNLEQDGRAILIKITKILPPSPKNLNEVRGHATSDYQNYLEQEWLNELRRKFPVQVNQAEVQKLTQK